MARVLITGSSDGLGLMAGEILAQQGHEVTLHARSDARADEARKACPKAAHVVLGDVATLDAMKRVADQANALGTYDAVIHNVAIGYRQAAREETVDGIERLFAINVIAPYVLTALVHRPKRLVYLSSGMHRGGDANLRDPEWKSRRWNGSQAYATSKLYDTVLAFAVARLWPNVRSNAVEPGWVPTKMGGAGAPDDLSKGAVTQAWLAESDDSAANVTAGYFFHQKPREALALARDVTFQNDLMAYCADRSGVAFPV